MQRVTPVVYFLLMTCQVSTLIVTLPFHTSLFLRSSQLDWMCSCFFALLKQTKVSLFFTLIWMHQSRRAPKSLYQLCLSISLYQHFCHSLLAENLSLSLKIFFGLFINKLQKCWEKQNKNNNSQKSKKGKKIRKNN